MRREDEISQRDTRPAYRGGGLGFISQSPTKRRIEFQGINAFVPGISAIHDAWIEVDGERVTSLESNTPFTIKASFTAANVAGGLLNSWSAAVTVLDLETGQIRNWKFWNEGLFTGDSISKTDAKINKLGQNTMPDHNLTLRIKLWANDIWAPSPNFPPETMW